MCQSRYAFHCTVYCCCLPPKHCAGETFSSSSHYVSVTSKHVEFYLSHMYNLLLSTIVLNSISSGTADDSDKEMLIIVT